MNIQEKINFIEDYKKARNAATGSKYDANSNVTNKNIATMAAELPKKDTIDLNRAKMKAKLTEMYGEEMGEQYIKDLASHIIYKHDETNIIPTYCASISMYPFLLNGLKSLGGSSGAPQHIRSFCGEYINLCFLVASQLAGAVATPEFLCYFDHFMRKDYGNDYYLRAEEEVNHITKETIGKVIDNYFEQVVHSINQPAAARGSQSIFLNIAYFDKGFFNSIFKDFYFPDGDEPCWESTSWLQKRFMKWFNKERLRQEFAFPVETFNLLNDEQGRYVDQDSADFVAEMYAEGHSFFTYRSGSVDALSSCCRLRNAVESNIFSYTLGAGGIQTGSKGVITININRLVQDATKINIPIKDAVEEITNRVHKYLAAHNEIVWEYYNAKMLPVFSAGFCDLDKQYLTLGINGFIEGAEFLDINIDPYDEDYKQYVADIAGTIASLNATHRSEHIRYNSEFVPGESLGLKNAKWDRRDGYYVPRDCYNSYFYRVEEPMNILDKFRIHGDGFTNKLDGGSALHMNLEEHLDKTQYRKLLDVSILVDCPYFTFNIPNTICNECGHISKHYLDVCPKCGSTDLDYLTRVIGYLRRISNFSEGRQTEAEQRYYGKAE